MLAVLSLIGCASGDPAASGIVEAGEDTAAVAETSSGDDPNEIICRREQVTGTNFRRRVCLTRAEREAARQQTREEMQQRQSSGALL